MKKRDTNAARRSASPEGEALDALNMRTVRKGSARRQIEQVIQAKSTKRRTEAAPKSVGL